MMAAARTVLGDNRPARAEATQRQPSLFGAKNQTTIETMAVPAASAAFYRTSDLKTELASQGATRRQPSLVGAKKKTTIDTTAVPASPAAFYRTSDLKTETASQGATQRQPSLFGAENQTTMETMAVPAAPEALYRTSDLKTELTSWGADELSTKNKAGPASGRDKGGPPCESLGAAADAATAQPLQGCVGPVDARRRCVLGELWAPSVALGASNLKDVKDPGFLEDHELRGTAAIVAFSIIESTVWGKLKAQQAAKMCCTLMGMESRPVLLDCLLSSCAEWHHRRHVWLPLRICDRGAKPDEEAAAGAAAWRAFVEFLAELLVAITGEGRSGRTYPHPSACYLAILLFDSFEVIARFPARDVGTEMEFLQFVLERAGAAAHGLVPINWNELVSILQLTCAGYPAEVEPVLQWLRHFRDS